MFSLSQGSGKHDRILKEDILAYKEKGSAAQKQASPQAQERPQQAATTGQGNRTVKMNQIMQGMVKSMNYSATVPHFYLKDEFDVTRIVLLALVSSNLGKRSTKERRARKR